MYNIYVEEKKQKEIENKKKEELKLLKYKEKYNSKFININSKIISIN